VANVLSSLVFVALLELSSAICHLPFIYIYISPSPTHINLDPVHLDENKYSLTMFRAFSSDSLGRISRVHAPFLSTGFPNIPIEASTLISEKKCQREVVYDERGTELGAIWCF
jgi:hypothetical protein